MQKTAGLFFFLGGAVILMGIVTAEMFYPGYSISQNMISNLGATPPPDSIIRQPSATIFDNSMKISGVLVMIGAYLLYKIYKDKLSGVTTFLVGVGAFGVGIFPAFHKIAHPIAALIAFASAGIAAVVSAKITLSPFRYIAILLGVITLSVLSIGILIPHVIVPLMGVGGTERWVAYPAMLWLIVFGGYMMNEANTKKK